MKVLIVWPAGMAPNIVGRIEALASHGVEVALVCAELWPEGGALVNASDAAADFPIFPLKTANTGRGAYYFYLPGISSVVRRFKPDLLHLREEVYTVAGAQFLMERSIRFPSVPFIFESWQNIRKRYPFPSRLFEAWGYRSASGAIAGAPMVEPVIRFGGFHKPIEVIPLGGYDPELFYPGLPLYRNDPPRVGFLGRLSPDKGVDVLIQAAASCRADLELVIAGDGPSLSDLKSLAAAQSFDTTFLGPVAQSEVPGLLRSIDLVVLPSRTTLRWKEQWGRVLTEAMASGTPVIGSSSGEIPSVIGDAGIVFEEGSVEDLARSLERVLGSADLANRLSAAGLKGAAPYTWDHHAERTKSFYDLILP